METPQDIPQEFIDLETAVTLFKKPKMTIWRAGKSLDTSIKQRVNANSPKGWKWVYDMKQLEKKLNQSPSATSYHDKKAISDDGKRYKVSVDTNEKLIDMLLQEKDARINYLTKELDDKNNRIQFLETRSDNLIGRVLEVLKLNPPKGKKKPIEIKPDPASEPASELQAESVNKEEIIIEIPPHQLKDEDVEKVQTYPQDTP